MPDARGNVGHLSALLIAMYTECAVNTVSKSYILTGVIVMLIAAEFGEYHNIPDSSVLDGLTSLSAWLAIQA